MHGNAAEYSRRASACRDRGSGRLERGRSYTAQQPLFYADLVYEQDKPQVQYYDMASPYTGFRVVVDIP